MQKRRDFLKKTVLGAAGLNLIPFVSGASTRLKMFDMNDTMPKISLAQWSLHKEFQSGALDPFDFASIATKTYGIDAVEYVNQFYVAHANDSAYWKKMNQRCEDLGVSNQLIMVDNEGLLGDTSDTLRLEAVENHYKWIEAAKILGCHSIRVNAFGQGPQDTIKAALVDGLGNLAAYGKKAGIHVLIENHGLFSSNADFILDIIKQVDNPYLGTLPDFGNWCLTAEWGSTDAEKACGEVYPPAEGIEKWLPFAKAVSAKSYDFDATGGQPLIDYPTLLQLVKNSGFKGYIGIEYEGQNVSPHEGIKATKALIERTWASLD